MTTIGVYDSGIGGLTTLKILEANFPFCNFYYLADNKNMPFGSKSKTQLEGIISSALKKLKAHSEIQVIACNTASTLIDDDVIKLLPPTTKEGKTLVMATPMTISHLKDSGQFTDERYLFADTSELASLVEVYAYVGARNNCLNLKELAFYLAPKLFEFKGVQNVVLGCSHYLYAKNEISRILGAVSFVDGNSKIVETLKTMLSTTNKNGSISFDFTADDETSKYQKIYSLLKATN